MRFFSAILGTVFILVLVYLGYLTNEKRFSVIWFGVATTLLSPLGFSLISWSFSKRKDEVFEQLAKIPQIEQLLKSAQSEEERLRILKEEHEQLENTIIRESKRQALIARKQLLEEDAIRVLRQLEGIDEEIATQTAPPKGSAASAAVENLSQRVLARDGYRIALTLFGNTIFIHPDTIKGIPFGRIILSLLRLLEDVKTNIGRRYRKSEDQPAEVAGDKK